VDHIPVDFFAAGYHYEPGTLHANVEKLLFPNNSISLILSFHVLEHVRRLDQGLMELHRVLEEEGHLLVEVPCSKHRRNHTDCRNFHKGNDLKTCAGQHDHVWRFSCDAFLKQVEDEGFSCDQTNQGALGLLYPTPQYLCRKVTSVKRSESGKNLSEILHR